MTDIIKAADSGDKLTLLKALRDKLAETLQESRSGRDIAALTKRLVDVAAEIEELEKINKIRNPKSKHDALKRMCDKGE